MTNLQLNEFENANRLIREKLGGHESVPVAIAMLSAAIDFLIKNRRRESDIKELVEKAIAKSRGSTIVMPTPEEVAKKWAKPEVAKWKKGD